jgi:uncharacterized protein (TIGR04222 family)
MAMGHPWGLSGPDFLWLYGSALVVALGVAIYLRWAARRPRLAEPAPVTDANVVAYLVGGARQVVETSLARLVGQGVVRVSREGTVATTTSSVPDPLDQAVLERVSTRGRRLHVVLDRAVGVKPIAGLAENVAARGLWVSPAKARMTRLLSLILPYLLLAVGIARLINGIAGNYPVGFLILELLAALVLVGMLHAWNAPSRTVHGDSVVAAARGSHDAETLVALDGIGAYPDQDIASALRSTRFPPPAPKVRNRSARAGGYGTGGYAAGGYIASCSGSASSSCGGSSSGGSSCGGGGGCGGGGT